MSVYVAGWEFKPEPPSWSASANHCIALSPALPLAPDASPVFKNTLGIPINCLWQAIEAYLQFGELCLEPLSLLQCGIAVRALESVEEAAALRLQGLSLAVSDRTFQCLFIHRDTRSW